jgi:hypothetical protein
MERETVGPLRPENLTRSALEQGPCSRSNRYNSRALMWRKLVGRVDGFEWMGNLRFRALGLANFCGLSSCTGHGS